MIAAGLLLGAFGTTPCIEAQETRVSPESIGQIVDAVISALVPPNQRVSGISIANRGIFFDYTRTVKAFGYSDTTQAPFRDLRVRTPMNLGSLRMFDDCSQIVPKPCAGLGWGVYVEIDPVSVTRRQANVRATIQWADRAQVFEAGAAPAGNAYLTGFSANVILIRGAFGKWKYAKTAKTLVF